MSQINRLIEVTERLLDKDTGCPWDLKQTHQTLTKHTLEEVHELLHAINSNDIENTKEELGDLLFQLVFYAKIAEQNQQYNFDDVINTVSDKLIRRHPHIFSGKSYANLEEQQADWQRIKLEEKGTLSTEHPLLNESYQALPSLEQGVYFQKVAAKLGFDWTEPQDTIPKIHEELDELSAEIEQGDCARLKEEYGDLLFACLNLGRKLKIDSDNALRQANLKFINRFEKIIELAGNQSNFEALSLDEKEALWQQAKALKKAQ